MMVITEKAGEKIKGILSEEKKENYGLRVYVAGGGCHGFEYGMVFEERANDDNAILFRCDPEPISVRTGHRFGQIE